MPRAKLVLTDKQSEQVEALIREGVPTRWIAEDIKVPYEALRGLLSGREDVRENGKQFNRVWTSIRPNETLSKWHAMFAPPSAVI